MPMLFSLSASLGSTKCNCVGGGCRLVDWRWCGWPRRNARQEVGGGQPLQRRYFQTHRVASSRTSQVAIDPCHRAGSHPSHCRHGHTGSFGRKHISLSGGKTVSTQSEQETRANACEREHSNLSLLCAVLQSRCLRRGSRWAWTSRRASLPRCWTSRLAPGLCTRACCVTTCGRQPSSGATFRVCALPPASSPSGSDACVSLTATCTTGQHSCAPYHIQVSKHSIGSTSSTFNCIH